MNCSGSPILADVVREGKVGRLRIEVVNERNDSDKVEDFRQFGTKKIFPKRRTPGELGAPARRAVDVVSSIIYRLALLLCMHRRRRVSDGGHRPERTL